MKIIDNKSLRYTKTPGSFYSGMARLETDTSKMYLTAVERQRQNKLLLGLKTEDLKFSTHVKAIDVMGVRDLDLIESELKNNFIHHSYKEILNTDFKPKAPELKIPESRG